MGKRRTRKKVAKLESKADKFREKAAGKAEQLSQRASAKADELQASPKNEKSGRKGMLALLLATAGGAALFFKKKRDQELDEALWEEPKNL